MPVSYVKLKCTSCASTRFHQISKTMWQCDYCDTKMEREEKPDSMYTIKNVVRQALIGIAGGDMDSARGNLTECQKIDMKYAGTQYVQLAYDVTMWKRPRISDGERRNYMEKMKADRAVFLQRSDPDGGAVSESELSEEEQILIGELAETNAPDASGLLILIFDLVALQKRRDAILKSFDPSEIYNMNLNSELIGFALKTENYAMFDRIIRNTNNINKKTALKRVMEKYPDGEKKAENISLLVSADADNGENDAANYEEYLRSTGDCFETRLAAAKAFCKKPNQPSVGCLMECVISQAADAEQVKELFSLLFSRRLNDREVSIILDYAIRICADDVCIYLLQSLKQTGQYVVFTLQQLSGVLGRADSTAEGRIGIIDACAAFQIDARLYDGLMNYYLCEKTDSPEDRAEIIRYLLSRIPAPSPNTVERYLTLCPLDQERKPEIVRMLFGGDFNRSLFQNTIEKYLGSVCDAPAVKREVLFVLSGIGLAFTASACIRLLTNNSLEAAERIEFFRRIKNDSLDCGALTDQYLKQIAPADYKPEILTELVADARSVTADSVRRYVMEISESSASKTGNVAKLLSICFSKPADIQCSLNTGGDAVSCSLLYAYMLSAPDDTETAPAVAAALGASIFSGGERIFVNGSSIKFKKYASALQKRGDLSPASAAACRSIHAL